MGVVVINTFCLTSLNALLKVVGLPGLGSSISQTYLLSSYLVYILIGYFVSEGLLSKFSSKQILGATLMVYVADVLAQIYYYASPTNYLISYQSLGLLVLSTLLFETLRRSEHSFECCKRPLCLLSAQSFALYFVHIVIMSLLKWYCPLNLAQPLMVLLFDGIAIFGGLLIIHLFKRIPFVGKYVFSLKG